MKTALLVIASAFSLAFITTTEYPIDGYERTGIRRLIPLQKIVNGEIQGNMPIEGALKSYDSIRLNLLDERGDCLDEPWVADPVLQKKINALFPRMDESYSISIMDITPGKQLRYATRQDKRQYQPGSVGKLAVATAFFKELSKIYPDSFEFRTALMRSKCVEGGSWSQYDEHEVPVYDTATNKLVKRTVRATDVFTLYEWVDHMLSVSNNGAASVVWREAVLMHVFGKDYPGISPDSTAAYFKNTPRSELSKLAIGIVNEPLRELGIDENEWRLGTFFTRGAEKFIPGQGGSTGTTRGLMEFMVALERGQVVDDSSSLELKRLMYMTDRRIRYAASNSLTKAAVYFKSGSLYGCTAEEGYRCEKYKGNRMNYMNSIAIVEHPDSTTYLVALMSNVLKKNSSTDHFYLASSIDKAVRQTSN